MSVSALPALLTLSHSTLFHSRKVRRDGFEPPSLSAGGLQPLELANAQSTQLESPRTAERTDYQATKNSGVARTPDF